MALALTFCVFVITIYTIMIMKHLKNLEINLSKLVDEFK